jgi:hypothetical protein
LIISIYAHRTRAFALRMTSAGITKRDIEGMQPVPTSARPFPGAPDLASK